MDILDLRLYILVILLESYIYHMPLIVLVGVGGTVIFSLKVKREVHLKIDKYCKNLKRTAASFNKNNFFLFK